MSLKTESRADRSALLEAAVEQVTCANGRGKWRTCGAHLRRTFWRTAKGKEVNFVLFWFLEREGGREGICFRERKEWVSGGSHVPARGWG